MKALLDSRPEHIKQALRGNMHKIAAKMTEQDGIQLPPGETEITIKTGVYALGVRIAKQRFEKRAMLDGIMSIARL